MASKQGKGKLFRTIKLKIGSVENREIFDDRFDKCFDLFRHILNEIPYWGMDKILVEDTEGTIQSIKCEDKRRWLYDQYIRKKSEMTFEKFSKLLGEIAEINNKQGVIDKKQGIFVKTSEANWARSVISLRIAGFLDRFDIDNSDTQLAEKFGILKCVVESYKGWSESDKAARESYAKEENEISAEFGKIPDEHKDLIKKFYQFCISGNYLREFSKKSKSYFKDCVVPQLKKSGKVNKHFCMLDRGDKQSFSLSPDLINYLGDHHKLLDDVDGEPLLVRYSDLLELMARHNRHRDGAAFPFVGQEDHHRFRYKLGLNYKKYKLNYNGTDLGNISGISGKQISDFFYVSCSYRQENQRIDRVIFQILIRDKYYDGSYNPSQYLSNLKIWKKEDCVFVLEFDRHGRTVMANVSEPCIVKEDNEYYLRLDYVVLLDNEFETDLKYYLNSAYPSRSSRSKLNDKPKNIERLNRIKDIDLKVMGVDLGYWLKPFSYAIAKTTIRNIVNDFNILNTGVFEFDRNDEYFKFIRYCRLFKQIIKASKSKNSYPGDLDGYEEIKEEEGFEEKSNNPRIFRVENWDSSNRDWIGHPVYRFIKKYFYQLKRARQNEMKGEKRISNNPFQWIDCIIWFKGVILRRYYLGKPKNCKRANVEKLNDYYNNFKAELMKFIASRIVKVAMDNECGLIVLEKLGNMGLRSKKSNKMWSIWSPRMLAKAVENAAEGMGICVVQVDAKFSSEIDFETGKFGYRPRKKNDPGERFNLYVERNNNIASVDADQNAAKNLINRALSRHAKCRYISVGTDNGTDNGTRKFRRGIMTYEFGSVNKANDWISSWFRDYRGYIVKHGDEWITYERKEEIREQIKQQLNND